MSNEEKTNDYENFEKGMIYMKILKKGGVVEKRGEEETKSMPHAPVIATGVETLREYDTVARADNYFAEYRMLFSRRRGNERAFSRLRGSCIDVIKSRLRKNLKEPASSRIMPFLKEGEIRRRKKCSERLKIKIF